MLFGPLVDLFLWLLGCLFVCLFVSLPSFCWPVHLWVVSFPSLPVSLSSVDLLKGLFVCLLTGLFVDLSFVSRSTCRSVCLLVYLVASSLARGSIGWSTRWSV